jgi:RNA polymerase sigma-70 factor (ECF subfamily)
LHEQFLSRLQQQDEAAVTALAEDHAPALYRYLYCLTHDGEVAADCVQETLLRAYRALPSLAADSALTPWLFTIATNVARNYHRRQQLVRWVRLEWLQLSHQSHEQAVVQQALVGQILQQLPLNYRICLVLHYWRGLSCAEIGAIMGKSEANVRKLLERARERFRTLYESDSSSDKGEYDEH